MKNLLATLVLALSLPGLGQAQHELVLTDHHHLLKGEVVSSTADSVTFNHIVGDTSDTQTYQVDAIDPHSFYIIRSKAVENDAAGKVELGKYCEAHGLFTRARNQYIEAMKLDKSLDLAADIARAKQGTAEGMVTEAKSLAQQGKHAEAHAKAAAVVRRFPDTPTADEARKVTATAHKAVVDARNAKVKAQEAKSTNAEAGSVQTDIHKAADANTKGLQEVSSSASKRELERSIQEYQAALKKIDGLSAKGNPDAIKGMSELRKQARKGLIDAYINLGSLYLTQTDYQGALKQANGALAVDPGSDAAKSFRARVASAASDTEINVYGRRGGVIHRR